MIAPAAARSARPYGPHCASGRRSPRGVNSQPALRGYFSTGLDSCPIKCGRGPRTADPRHVVVGMDGSHAEGGEFVRPRSVHPACQGTPPGAFLEAGIPLLRNLLGPRGLHPQAPLRSEVGVAAPFTGLVRCAADPFSASGRARPCLATDGVSRGDRSVSRAEVIDPPPRSGVP